MRKPWHPAIRKTLLIEIMNTQFEYFAREKHVEITEVIFDHLFGKETRLSREMLVFENERGETVGFTAVSNFLGRKSWRLVNAILPKYLATPLPDLLFEASIFLGKNLGINLLEFFTTGLYTAPFDRALEKLGFFVTYFLLRLQLTNWQEEKTPELPQEVSIRHLNEPDDLVQYTSVENNAFRPITGYQPTTVEKVKERIDFRRIMRESDFFLAYHSEKLVGYCYLEYDPKDVKGEIHTLAVHSNYQRRGIGKYLLIQGIKQLKSKKCKEIELTALFDNQNANDLYYGLGFRSVESMKSRCYHLTC